MRGWPPASWPLPPWRLALTLWAGLMVILAAGQLHGGDAEIARAQGPHRGPYPPTTDACARCHRAHTANRAGLLIRGGGGRGWGGGFPGVWAAGQGFPRLTPDDSLDAFCFACHNGTGAGATAPVSAHGNRHAPADPASDQAEATAAAPFHIGCVTCHDPHGSPNAYGVRVMLPWAPGEGDTHSIGPILFQGRTGQHSFDDGQSPPASRLCVACHQAVGTLQHAGGADHAGNFDFSGENCLTCHPHSADAFGETVDGFITPPQAWEQLVARARVDLALQGPPADLTARGGEALTLTWQVHNHGPQDAWQVQWQFHGSGLNPAWVRAWEASDQGRCEWEEQTLVCTWEEIPAHAARVVRLTLVPPARQGPTVLPLEATVHAQQTDPDATNNAWRVAWPCRYMADLALQVEGPEAVDVDQKAEFTFSITNQGPAVAHQVVLEGWMPPEMALEASHPEQGLCAPQPHQRVTCDLGTLEVGQTVVVRWLVSAVQWSSDALPWRAVLAAAEEDPNLTDNQATWTVVVREQADLQATWETAPRYAAPGQEITLSFVVVNAGPRSTAAVLEGHWPGTVLRLEGCPGAPEEAQPAEGNAWRCVWAELSPQEPQQVQVQVQAPNAVGPAAARLMLAPLDVQDPNPDNNQSTVEVVVTRAPDVALEGQWPQVLTPGVVTSVYWQVRNHGPVEAQGVGLWLGVAPNAGVTLQPQTEDGPCTPEDEGWWCPVGTLPVGTGKEVQVVLLPAPEAQDAITLWAEARSPQQAQDPDPDNQAQRAEVRLQPRSDVTLTATVEPEPLPGQPWRLTLTVENGGPSWARQLVLQVPWPDDVQVWPWEEGENPACHWEPVVEDEGATQGIGQVLVCRWEVLASNAGEQVTLQVLPRLSSEPQVLQAQVEAATLDPHPEDNQLEIPLIWPTPTPTPTATPPSPTPTPTPTAAPPSPTPTPTPTVVPPSPTPTPTVVPPSPTPTPTPTAAPPSPTPTPTPTAAPPSPTPTPTAVPPSPTPTPTPTAAPF